MFCLVSVSNSEAFRDLAEVWNSEPPGIENIKKSSRLRPTVNRLDERIRGTALRAQFHQPFFRENNSRPLFPTFLLIRIIVGLN